MFTGTLSLDVLLGDVRSLKEKRAVVRPLVAELRRRFPVSAAEVGNLDLHRRAEIGVAVVAADARHCRDVLEAAEQLVAARPEVDLLAAHRDLHSSTEEEKEEDHVADRARAHKLADRIRTIVAETLERRVKDPRLGFVTVTDTRVTGDLHDATVFYTVYGDENARAETAAALDSVKGLLRSEVGRQTGVRFTPTLTFVADAIPENAARIDDLLRQAQESDAEVARAAAGAAYAGEPDPYKAPNSAVDPAAEAPSEDEDASA